MKAQVADQHLFRVALYLRSKRGGLLRSFWPTPWHIPCDLPSNKYVSAEKEKKIPSVYRLEIATSPVKPPYNDLPAYNVIFNGWSSAYTSIPFDSMVSFSAEIKLSLFIIITTNLTRQRPPWYNEPPYTTSNPWQTIFQIKRKYLFSANTEQINFITSRLQCYTSHNSPLLTVWMKKTSKFLASGLRSFVLKQKKTSFNFKTDFRDQRNDALPVPSHSVLANRTLLVS